jgi:hypothetical protein
LRLSRAPADGRFAEARRWVATYSQNDDDLLELRAALELALECDFEIDGGITVSDLFDAIIAQSKAA